MSNCENNHQPLLASLTATTAPVSTVFPAPPTDSVQLAAAAAAAISIVFCEREISCSTADKSLKKTEVGKIDRFISSKLPVPCPIKCHVCSLPIGAYLLPLPYLQSAIYGDRVSHPLEAAWLWGLWWRGGYRGEAFSRKTPLAFKRFLVASAAEIVDLAMVASAMSLQSIACLYSSNMVLSLL